MHLQFLKTIKLTNHKFISGFVNELTTNAYYLLEQSRCEILHLNRVLVFVKNYGLVTRCDDCLPVFCPDFLHFGVLC